MMAVLPWGRRSPWIEFFRIFIKFGVKILDTSTGRDTIFTNLK